MKVVLSNRAYLKVEDEELWDYLRKHTTYTFENYNARYPEVFQNSGSVSKNVKWIPTTRVDLLESFGIKNIEFVDKRIVIPANIPKPTFTLRPEDQQIIYDNCEGTCLINAKPGFGKTILALGIAYKFQQKTLVICTNTNIREMWAKEVRTFFGFEPGIIGSSKFNIDSPIVIGNIQSLNKHSIALAKEFGVVIVDEVHHCVATTFSNFLDNSYAPIKIGLSGTLKRKDGKNVMFKDYFGYTVFTPEVNNTLIPNIHRYKVPIEISGNIVVPWADRANSVYDNPEYQDYIVGLALLYAKIGHKVLLTTDRTHIANMVYEKMLEFNIPAFKITGLTPMDDRLQIMDEISEIEGGCVLAAAQSIFAEGVSLNELSCVIPATLINNESLVEQLAGRVQRIVEGKLDPIYVDLIMKGVTGGNQARARKLVFTMHNWPTIDITDRMRADLAKIAFASG